MAAQSATQFGHNNIVVQAHGDNIHVEIGLPHLKLIPVHARLEHHPRNAIDLLDPAYQSVPLVGREPDLRFLHDWLASHPAIAITAIVGPGGSGKTRLALEFLQQLPESWQGGILTGQEAERFSKQENLSEWGWQKPTFIVADYAALMSGVLAKWFSELVDNPSPPHKLRILLLERHADPKFGWYHDLADGTWHGRAVRELLSPEEPRRVAPLDQIDQRRAVLEAGIRAASFFHPEEIPAPALPTPGTDDWFDQRLAADQWSDPLLLLIAAVIALSDGWGAALSLSRVDLATRIAERECSRIENAANSRVEGRLLAYLYGCVTLCGGLDRKTAIEVAEKELHALHKNYQGGAGQAVDDLSRVLGVTNRLPPLSPDLIGEALLPLALSDGADVTARMANVALGGVTASLIRSAQDFGHAGQAWPLEWLKSLVSEGENDPRILMEIEDSLPVQSVILRKLALEVTQSLIGQLSSPLEPSLANQAYVAQLLNSLSNRQSEMGQRAEALASISEAVNRYRALTRTADGAFLPLLAIALANQANRRMGLGRPAEALESATEAVAIRRKLADIKPDAFLPDLAKALNTLANIQSELGKRSEALDSIEEAVKIRRTLTEVNPEEFLSDLAMSLSNQSNLQGKMGQGAEALASIKEAVERYRILAQAHPDSFLPDLALTLNNQANKQSKMGLLTEAMASIAEAVDYYRVLAQANPDAFLHDLAMALNNRGNRQREMGQLDEALDSVNEAVKHYQALSRTNPSAFLHYVARAMGNRAGIHIEQGRWGEASASINESLNILRALSRYNPDAFLPDLATALKISGDCLAGTGKLAEARDAAAESLLVLAPFFSKYPGAFTQLAEAAFRDYINRSRELSADVNQALLSPYAALVEPQGEEGEPHD
jgi:tetratricopeptide (TPR) repeat protein